LRAIDSAGKAGVLRSQLRIVHEATRRVADDPVGHVIGADFLYDEQSPVMQQSGVLLKEIDELIRGLRAEGPDGILQSRICALVFLLDKIPPVTIGGESGLRATAPFLADLLVEDLADDGARLRKRVPELLDTLVTAGSLQRINDEYQLQTAVGAEWEKDYQRNVAVNRDDATRLTLLRTERLEAAVKAALGGLKLPAGASRTTRDLDIHWGQDEPTATVSGVPVWIRDEWSVSTPTVKKAAAEAGVESPVVFVLLPKHEAEQIKHTLASHAAAEDTLGRPTPHTDEGKAAERAMKTRLAMDNDRLSALFADVAARARVFQGGGNELTTGTLRAAVETAAGRSLIRLFPKFGVGDHADWSKVVAKARDGAPDALVAVGHHGEPATNPVCKDVLAAISPGGTKGLDLQKGFTAPPYGWPQDAVRGAVMTLLAAGNIRAAQDGKSLAGPKELQPNQIGRTTFYKEDEPPTVGHRLAVRGLLTAAGIKFEFGQEGAQLAAFLQQLKELAGHAGGPPPLPEPPSSDHVDALLALGGNQRFRAVADSNERLLDNLAHWRAADQQRAKRESEWRDLQRLLRHARDLPIAAEVTPTSDAIRDGRQLLDEPNPMTPILAALSTALRDEVNDRAQRLAAAKHDAVVELGGWDGWSALDPADRQSILTDAQLEATAQPDVANGAALLDVLETTPLAAWQDQISLVPSRRDQARQRAAKKLEPESVSVAPQRATVKNTDDLDAYLDDLRGRVQPHLAAGRTVNL